MNIAEIRRRLKSLLQTRNLRTRFVGVSHEDPICELVSSESPTRTQSANALRGSLPRGPNLGTRFFAPSPHPESIQSGNKILRGPPKSIPTQCEFRTCPPNSTPASFVPRVHFQLCVQAFPRTPKGFRNEFPCTSHEPALGPPTQPASQPARAPASQPSSQPGRQAASQPAI